MPKETQIVNFIELQKRAMVESAIYSNARFKMLINTIHKFPGLKIDINEMIDSYMDMSSGIKIGNESSKINIDENLINELISGVIYSISHEENGVVLESDGEIDIEETIKSRMMLQGHYIEGIEGLNEEQLKKISSEFEQITDSEKVENKEKFLSIFEKEEINNQFLWDNEKVSSADLEFLQGIIAGSLSKDDTFKYMRDIVKNEEFSRTIERDEDSNFIYTKEQLELIKLGVQYNDPKYASQRDDIKQKILDSEEAKRTCIDPKTGKVDFESALKRADSWKQNYTMQKRKQAFDLYTKKRGENYIFSELGFEEREFLLGSAIQAFNDPNSPIDVKKAAQSVLVDISPDFLTVSKDKNGAYRTEINPEVAKSVFNGMRKGKNIETFDEIISHYTKMEDDTVLSKLDFLSKEENFKLREEWKQIRRGIKDVNLESIAKKLKELRKSDTKSNLVVNNVQKKLEMRINATLDLFRNNENRPIPYDEKINTVMSAYMSLKASTTLGPQMQLSNLEINKKALELLESHILANPIKYGNFIDENEDGTRQINTDKIDTRNYTRRNKENYQNLQEILTEVQQTAREELYKDSSFREKISRDGVETVGVALKDGIKFFVKGGMKVVLGEERTKNVLDTIKGNELYSKTRKNTYKFFRTAHDIGKGIGKIITKPMSLAAKQVMNLLPNSNQLALPSADNGLMLSITDLQKYIRDGKKINYIDSREKYEVIKAGIMQSSKGKIDENLKGNLRNSKYASQYINPETGNFDVDGIIVESQAWADSYITQKRAQSFMRYNSMKENGKSFEQLSQIEKYKLLSSIICTINDKNALPEMKKISEAILADISPKAIGIERDSDGRTQIKVNNEEFLKLYNESVPQRPLQTMEEVRALFSAGESRMITKKLDSLGEQDKWMTRDEWMELTASKLERDDTSLSKRKENFSIRNRIFSNPSEQKEVSVDSLEQDPFKLSDEYVVRTDAVSHMEATGQLKGEENENSKRAYDIEK